MRRLSPAFLTMAMLGVVGLLVVMYVGKKLLAREAPPAEAPISVPMALADLEPGTRITEAHLANGPAVRSKLSREIVLTSRALVGRVVKNRIPATQPIKSTDLYAPGQSAPLDLEPGMVAVVMQVSSPFAATTGQYVDVLFTPESAPDREETGGSIMTLLKGVKIVQMNNSSGNRGAINVTLELTREQAHIIQLAQRHGDLSYVYAPEGKGQGGVGVSDEDRATLYEILGYTPKPREEPELPFQTEVFVGSTREVATFNKRGERIRGQFNDSQGIQEANPNTLPIPRGNSIRGIGNGGTGSGEGGMNRNNSDRNSGGGNRNGGPSAAIVPAVN